MQAPNTPSSQITQMMEPPESPPFPSSDSSIPLTMAMIGIISTALSITLYHLVMSKFCVQRGHNHRDTAANEIPSGVDQKVLNSIPIQAYSHKQRASCVSDQCAVCLAEFEEGDSARLLPNCQHLFHLQCIDAWFVSHSSCPMCRSPVLPVIIDADAARLPQQSVNQGSIVISIEEDDNFSAHNSRGSAASSPCHCSSLCFERKPQTRFLPPLHKRSLSDCSFVSAKTRLKDEHGPTSSLSSTSLEVQNICCSSRARESC